MQESNKQAHVLISSKCPNDCIFCAVSDKRRQNIFTSKDDVINFIKESALKRVSHITFSGSAEPTLDEHFEEYLAYANLFTFRSIALFTNGFGLTEEKVVKWKSMGLTNVLLSCHGTRCGHDKNVNRKGSFDEAIKALGLYTAHGLHVAVNTCLTRHNIHEIPALIGILTKYPIVKHYLSFPEWNGNTFNHIDELLTYNDLLTNRHHLTEKLNHTITFDNIPFCYIQKKTRELMGINRVTLLDGAGEVNFSNDAHNTYPEICQRRKCKLIGACSGFDKQYIKHYGWGSIEEVIGDFLDTFDFDLLKKPHKGPGYVLVNKSPLKMVKRQAEQAEEMSDKHLTVIVKPTDNCNSRCVYCSNDMDKTKAYMDNATAEKMFEALFKHAADRNIGRLNILWHGGEPLLMGKDFYTDVYERIIKDAHAKTGVRPRIHSSMQSNLLLVDEEWIDIFKRYHITVNTSVDPIVKSLRLTRDGTEQYGPWLQKFGLLSEYGVRTGIVFTVTSLHPGKEERIFTYFKNLLIRHANCSGVRFNPIYASGLAEDRQDLMLDADGYKRFLERMWELWYDEGQTLPFVPFTDLFNRTNFSCTFNADCYNHFLSVDAVGNTSICSRFIDAKTYTGNIVTDDLAGIMNGELYKDLNTRNKSLQEGHCSSCEYFKRCNGGCPYLGLIHNGDCKRESPFCEAYKALFSIIDSNTRK